MDVSDSLRSDGDGGAGSGLRSYAIGLVDVGARGFRLAFGRTIPGERLYDVTLGAALVSGELAARATDSARSLVAPLVSRLPQLPTFPLRNSWRGPGIIRDLEQRGRQMRLHDGRTVERLLDSIVPVLVEQVIARVGVEGLVQKHVDLQRIINTVDLDAVVDRVDVDRVATRLTVDALLDRIDLNAIVRDRVDVDAIVGAVDIDAVAARLDLDAVIERLDLPTLAQQVIDDIDLPVIIRESSGSMASEAVSGVRMHSIEADEAVHRALDRVLRRRQRDANVSDAEVSAADVEVAESTGVSVPSSRRSP